MSDAHDAAELRVAEALEREIDDVLGGRAPISADPTVLWLASAMRVDPPPALATRVAREHARRERARWRPAQVAAALLAYLFLSQGVGNIVNGEWVARGLGEAHSPHVYLEGGLALIAAGIAVGAGVLRRPFLPVSVAAGLPLGVVLGLNGVGEIGEFTAGAVLHISQGLVALALGAAWWWGRRRYGRARPDEGGA